jgi:hypothetical protein
MNDWDDMLDAYLNGLLSDEDARALEERVAQDPALAAEFDFRKAVKAALIQEEGQVLRARVQALTREATPTRSKAWVWWSIAASVVLLIGVFWFTRPGSHRLSPEALYAAYLDPQPNFDQRRDDIAGADTLRSHKLSVLYAQAAYSEILTTLAAVADSSKSLDELYLQAIAEAETGQNEAALRSADALLASGNAYYAAPTQRLKVLVLIKLGRYRAAQAQLPQLEALQPSQAKIFKDWLADAPEADCTDCR